MKVKYKIIRVKKEVAYCGDCGEELLGDNTAINPYRCSCGMWRVNWDNLDELKLISKAKPTNLSTN